LLRAYGQLSNKTRDSYGIIDRRAERFEIVKCSHEANLSQTAQRPQPLGQGATPAAAVWHRPASLLRVAVPRD